MYLIKSQCTPNTTSIPIDLISKTVISLWFDHWMKSGNKSIKQKVNGLVGDDDDGNNVCPNPKISSILDFPFPI